MHTEVPLAVDIAGVLSLASRAAFLTACVRLIQGRSDADRYAATTARAESPARSTRTARSARLNGCVSGSGRRTPARWISPVAGSGVGVLPVSATRLRICWQLTEQGLRARWELAAVPASGIAGGILMDDAA
jgi:hypothetical protein